jgi:chromosome segregation ATPase
MIEEEKTKEEMQSLKLMLTTLDDYIKQKEQEQNKIDNSINLVNKEIEKIDSTISKIKVQKVIIREYYHEKITNVDNFTDNEIDSFITNRYGK